MRELLCGCTNDSDTLYMCIVICAKRDKRTLFFPVGRSYFYRNAIKCESLSDAKTTFVGFIYNKEQKSN